ncbi:MAG: hypothetical protein LBV04_08490 [Deferribacteraceae bacterium]|jgi:hypothetical protein|nr:hypothetical protein [Deferribacteraceae bacterium]
MSYLICNVAGLEGWCNGFIANAQDELLYASVFGRNEAVRGIVSGLLDGRGRELELFFNGKAESFVRHKLNMTYRSTALKDPYTQAENVTHCLTYVPSLFSINEYRSTCVLIGKNYDDVCQQAYKILMTKGQTPLIPEWQSILMPTIWVNQLHCYGFDYVAEVSFPEQEALEQYMIDNIEELREATPQEQTLQVA